MPKKAWGGNLSTELLTVEQVADILHVTVDTVRIYIRNKELPAFKVGRSYLVRRGDVDRFLEKRRTIDEKE
ncbi:MAG: helix-turn-helix domain-containing protein [Ktedonobacteraceae bacterium]